MTDKKAHIAKTTIVIFVVLICALVLRLHCLNKYDLWFDELGTDMFSSGNLIKVANLSGISPLPEWKQFPGSPQ